jgi:hypothetical protein
MLTHDGQNGVLPMIELSSLMWFVAILTAIFGFLRGWRREVPVIASALMGIFLLLQLDVLLRAIPFISGTGREITFSIQTILFMLIIYYGYTLRQAPVDNQGRRLQIKFNSSASWLGALFGAINGWLVAGTIWYLMDINEYPLSPFIIAPAVNSPSADALGTLPVILFTGGLSGGSVSFLLVVAIAAIALSATSA